MINDNVTFLHARGGQQLYIAHVNPGHAGTYTCQAENDAGLDQRDFMVQVFGKCTSLLLL